VPLKARALTAAPMTGQWSMASEGPRSASAPHNPRRPLPSNLIETGLRSRPTGSHLAIYAPPKFENENTEASPIRKFFWTKGRLARFKDWYRKATLPLRRWIVGHR
jgi:hypothetical protein